MLRRARTTGFTLIELSVTMTLFGILVAMAVPSMRIWVANAKVRAVADGLQNGLRLAQAESLRRSRQVVFSLTNNPNPGSGGITAAANGSYWSINVIPSMTDGSEVAAAFVEGGDLGTTAANVTVTGPAAICFNSVGRLTNNAATGVTGATCSVTATPPSYVVAFNSADRSLQVNVALGGQVHMCDPTKTLSATNPDGC